MSECELNKLKNNETGSLGSLFSKTSCNTHKYVEGKKYIHFFLNKKSTVFFSKQKGQNYLCTFNIPVSVLVKSVGIGYYPSKHENENRGYDSIVNKKVEFAMDAEKFNPRWLKKVEKITTVKNNNEI